MPKTITDEIGDKVVEQVNKSIELGKGIVFGEEHNNEAFTNMLAKKIIPEAAAMVGDEKEKILHIEVHRTSEALADIDLFNRAGDEAARDRVIDNYMDFEDGGLNDQAWQGLFDSARNNGFQISAFDEKSVSVDSLTREFLKRTGQTEADINDHNRQGILSEMLQERIDKSNPVIINNIQDHTPDGAVSFVVIGDDHANEDNDVPEQLGYDYVRFVDKAADFLPTIKESTHYGASVDVALTSRALYAGKIANNVAEYGVDLAPAFLRDSSPMPDWLSDDNRIFHEALRADMNNAALMIETKQFDKVPEALEQAYGRIHDRYTDDQIANDPYLHSTESLLLNTYTATENQMKSELSVDPRSPASEPSQPAAAPSVVPEPN